MVGFFYANRPGTNGVMPEDKISAVLTAGIVKGVLVWLGTKTHFADNSAMFPLSRASPGLGAFSEGRGEHVCPASRQRQTPAKLTIE